MKSYNEKDKTNKRKQLDEEREDNKEERKKMRRRTKV
jgi:hypothetical protein